MRSQTVHANPHIRIESIAACLHVSSNEGCASQLADITCILLTSLGGDLSAGPVARKGGVGCVDGLLRAVLNGRTCFLRREACEWERLA